jgi:hypothetical protein
MDFRFLLLFAQVSKEVNMVDGWHRLFNSLADRSSNR